MRTMFLVVFLVLPGVAMATLTNAERKSQFERAMGLDHSSNDAERVRLLLRETSRSRTTSPASPTRGKPSSSSTRAIFDPVNMRTRLCHRRALTGSMPVALWKAVRSC